MAAALIMAAALDGATGCANVGMVFCYSALGLLSSIIGIALARIGKNGTPTRALNSSTYITTCLLYTSRCV